MPVVEKLGSLVDHYSIGIGCLGAVDVYNLFEVLVLMALHLHLIVNSDSHVCENVKRRRRKCIMMMMMRTLGIFKVSEV